MIKILLANDVKEELTNLDRNNRYEPVHLTGVRDTLKSRIINSGLGEIYILTSGFKDVILRSPDAIGTT